MTPKLIRSKLGFFNVKLLQFNYSVLNNFIRLHSYKFSLISILIFITNKKNANYWECKKNKCRDKYTFSPKRFIISKH